jgi:hypothetical protein
MARRLSTDAQLDDDKVRSLQSSVLIRRGCKASTPSAMAENALGQSADGFTTFLARVEQDEIVHDHPIFLVAQAVDEFGCVGTPPADDGNLDPHPWQRTIR